MEQIVIVGAGRAGAYAAATLRQEGFTGRIFLVGEEPVPPYDRPPLSKDVLVGKAAPIDGLIFKREYYDENTIDLCLGDPAIRLDVELRQLELRSGQSLKYDKLLLATGSRPRKLSWDPDSVSRLHYLRTAADAEAIAQLLKVSRRVAIVGGGVIGFEVAASARSLGCEVTVIEAAPQVMARMMPSEMAVYLVDYHMQRGVRVLTSARPSAVDGHGTTPSAVLLEDGRSVEADLVVVGIGITPEVGLARSGGLKVENGIVTDAYGQTSEACIYAAGDAASFFHPLFGRMLRLEAWRHAERHGQVVALNLLGRAVEYRDAPWMWSDQYDLHLQVTGLLDDADAFVSRGAWKEGAELIFALKGDRLRGAAGLGRTDAIGRDIRLAQLLIEAEIPIDAARLGDARVKLKSLLKARPAATPENGSELGGAGALSTEAKAMDAPIFKQVANLWSLWDYPSAAEPWSLEQQLDAVQGAGFDGITAQLGPRHAREAEKRGLFVVGYFSSGDEEGFADLLKSQKDAGARHINVQLANHDTDPADALRLTLRLMEEAERIGDLAPSIEVHRDTCTETPEKAYALVEGYFKATGELLPITWDFSHFAVVKHLTPENYVERLLVHPELIQRSQQFHFRPFNGHHCQVPVTRGDGGLTQEFNDWLPFVSTAMRIWLEGNAGANRVLIVVPEMGPVRGGYNLAQLPNSWEDAVHLRRLLEAVWHEQTMDRGVWPNLPSPEFAERQPAKGAGRGAPKSSL